MKDKRILFLLLVCKLINIRQLQLVEAYQTTDLYPRICDEDVVRDHSKRRNHRDYRVCNSYECHYEYPIINRSITCSHVDNVQYYLNSFTVNEDASYDITFKVIKSNIQIFPTSAFLHKQKLTMLYLEEANIEKFMPGAFNYLDYLRELYLKGNKLTSIPDGLFNSLTRMYLLDLSRNQIGNISKHAFVGLKLETLLLGNNNISEIEQELMNYLTDLKTFDISNNLISKMINFTDLTLHTLNMSRNKIDLVDCELLQSIDLKIDLSFNKINKIINFELLSASELILNHNSINKLEANPNVLYLDVRYNHLETIESHVFGTALRRLYLGNNFISKINVDAFYNLESLELLTLDNNNLSSIPNSCFKDLKSLVLLDLSGNKLTQFSYGIFDNLIYLQTLNISENQLTTLQPHLFHALVNLTHLYFAHNKINDLSIDMSHLESVDLRGNDWACKKLGDIVHTLKKSNTIFYSEDFWEGSNIRGIKCYEPSEISTAEVKSDINLDSNRLYDEDFTKTAMYKYLNNEFKDSNFFKYLESLKNTINATYIQNLNSKYLQQLINELQSRSYNESYNNYDFTKSKIYNYFDKDFQNSGFFKYLEKYKDQSIKQNHQENSPGRSDSNMYNYFDKDFKNSNFFKYLENLNAHVLAPNNLNHFNNSIMEKLISSSENEKITSYGINYTGLLSFIGILLAIIVCILLGIIYFFSKEKVRLVKREDVELI